MKSNRSILGFFAMAMMMSGTPQSGSAKIINPIQFGSGSGAGDFHWHTSPIFFPKKHNIESYRSQQRKSKKRK